MHILGLDFATKTGVAYGDAGAPPARIVTETWTLPSCGGEDVGAWMHVLRNKLNDRMMRGVSLVVFEAPYIARHKGSDGRWRESPDQIRRAFGAAAVCEELAYARNIACIEVVTVTAKKLLTGSGKVKKPDMVRAARQRGFAVQNDHEADAVACFLHGVTHYAPELAAIYDPLFANGGPRA